MEERLLLRMLRDLPMTLLFTKSKSGEEGVAFAVLGREGI